jgi:hypothetical protein
VSVPALVAMCASCASCSGVKWTSMLPDYEITGSGAMGAGEPSTLTFLPAAWPCDKI